MAVPSYRLFLRRLKKQLLGGTPLDQTLAFEQSLTFLYLFEKFKLNRHGCSFEQYPHIFTSYENVLEPLLVLCCNLGNLLNK